MKKITAVFILVSILLFSSVGFADPKDPKSNPPKPGNWPDNYNPGLWNAFNTLYSHISTNPNQIFPSALIMYLLFAGTPPWFSNGHK